jgi:hypothetical protein
MEIKRLNAAIAALRSELDKQTEETEECRRHVSSYVALEPMNMKTPPTPCTVQYLHTLPAFQLSRCDVCSCNA